MIKKFMYVSMLPEKKRKQLEQDLIKAGIRGEDFNDAMRSRLVDLEDVINIKKYL